MHLTQLYPAEWTENHLGQLHLYTWVFPAFNQPFRLNINRKPTEMMIYSGVSYFFWECRTLTNTQKPVITMVWLLNQCIPMLNYWSPFFDLDPDYECKVCSLSPVAMNCRMSCSPPTNYFVASSWICSLHFITEENIEETSQNPNKCHAFSGNSMENVIKVEIWWALSGYRAL